METTTCNLCGSDAIEDVRLIPDYLLERPQVTAALVRCRACGLVYQTPRPTLAEMAAHYPAEYEPYTDRTASKEPNPLLKRAYAYGTQKRTRFVTRRKSGGRLLDIGCASGTFLLGMQTHRGWQVQGVEPSAQVAEYARVVHNLDVFPGTLEEADFPAGAFDCVTMWDVLEHVHDPLGTLREISRVLKDDGIVVIRVPNLASWDATIFSATWAGLDAPRHLFVFRPETLKAMLAQANFGVIDLSCGIGGYVTFVLSVRFWMTAHQWPEKTKQRVTRLLYHPVARLISAPFFWAPSTLKRGPLMVVTARKRPIAS
jgi:2-polyprenyl-3-methyl-5-hydroxy-6-metoxy-1,4-benzoquinol methylase